ncbi:hypothetical protein K7432_013967 [Basidiobolus ranarum]|uniref:Rieske domain-containing protein n=1 Tax=Basidiobolus ranarum TaxID=34480 RepID=A0ABR2WIC2_9FUNG
MGKHKGKEFDGGSNGGVFGAYMNSISNQEQGGSVEETSYPDSMKASTLLEQIASERSWIRKNVNEDLAILERNRLYAVRDLRDLSQDSWKEIELLPIVKDLLRKSIKIGETKPEDEYRKFKMEKKLKKKQKKLEKRQAKEEMEKHRALTGAEVNSPESASSSSSSSSEEETNNSSNVQIYNNPTSAKSGNNNRLKYLPGPGRIQASGNRIRVSTGSGQVYEVDRYCPHKKVDLSSKGIVVGDNLICSKHNWSFSLGSGGKCNQNSSSIHACAVNDW